MSLDPETYQFLGELKAHMKHQSEGLTKVEASLSKIDVRIDLEKDARVKGDGDLKDEQTKMKTKLGFLVAIMVCLGQWIMSWFKGSH